MPVKLLIVGPSWVGDMVMAQSLFIDQVKRNVGIEIHVLAPAWTSAIVDRMPEVNSLITADFKHGQLGLGERLRLARQLKKENFTHAIVLPNSLKSALVPAFARIPKRVGYVGEQRWGLLNDIRRLKKSKLPMTVQRFVALGRGKEEHTSDIPPPALSVDSTQARKLAAEFTLNLDERVLCLCPGAEFGASKKWPVEHYAEVAQHFIENGWQLWLMGSDNDTADCLQISESLHPDLQSSCHVLAGRTTLPQAVDLLSLSDLVISNDSGLMHIAAGLGRPLVAIYGSTDPKHTPPLSENHSIVRLELDCSPCFKRDCPLGHLDCLTQLSSKEVISQAEKLVLS